MDNKLVICIVIFALTLLSYIINKIPMWVTALLSLAALYITGCVDANGALGGFANINTILMGACYHKACAHEDRVDICESSWAHALW